jgi:transposase InsO family protein
MSRALEDWAYQRGVQLDFIRPGKPVENAFIESFNGRLRDECLNIHQFTSIEDAKAKDRSLARRLQSASPTQLARAPDTERVRRPTSGCTDRRSGRVFSLRPVAFQDQRHDPEQSTFGYQSIGEAYGRAARGISGRASSVWGDGNLRECALS